MFIVTDRYTFTRTVEVFVPTDGGHERQDLKATFGVVPAEEQDSYDLGTTEGSTAFLEKIVVRFDDLAGEDKQPLAYSDALRDRLLRFQFIRLALVAAYTRAVNKAVEGN